MSRIKDITLCAVFLSLTALIWYAAMVLYETRDAISTARENFRVICLETGLAINSWKEYADDLKAQAHDPEVRRGIGLLLRSGDDLSRTIKKANNTLDNLNDAIVTTSKNINGRLVPAIDLAVTDTSHTINAQVLPGLAGVAIEAQEAIRAAKDGTERTTAALLEGMGTANRSLDDINRRINDPRIDAIIDNIDKSAGHANATLDNLERKTTDWTRPIRWLWRAARETIVILGRIFLP